MYRAPQLFRNIVTEEFSIIEAKLAAIYIVRFRADHFPAIMRIERASFGRGAYPRALFDELRAEPGCIFLVARSGGVIAGYILGCARGESSEIVSVAVGPSARGAGVGAALMEALVQRLAAAGALRADLVVRTDNEAAIRFYRRFGFRRLRRLSGYYEDGSDGWLMRKAL